MHVYIGVWRQKSCTVFLHYHLYSFLWWFIWTHKTITIYTGYRLRSAWKKHEITSNFILSVTSLSNCQFSVAIIIWFILPMLWPITLPFTIRYFSTCEYTQQLFSAIHWDLPNLHFYLCMFYTYFIFSNLFTIYGHIQLKKATNFIQRN